MYAVAMFELTLSGSHDCVVASEAVFIGLFPQPASSKKVLKTRKLTTQEFEVRETRRARR